MSAVKIFGGHPGRRGSQKNFDLGGRRLLGPGGLPTRDAPNELSTKGSQWTLGDIKP